MTTETEVTGLAVLGAVLSGRTVYRVLTYRYGELEKKSASMTRRSLKLGLKPIGVVKLGNAVRPYVDENGYDREYCTTYLTVSGEAPRVEGYDFIARIEHTEAGNVVSGPPNSDEDLSEYWEADPTCEHCKTKRSRKDTFVLREVETGKTKRVGRNCLADYLRGADASEALRVWAFLHEIEIRGCEDDEFGYGGTVGLGEVGTLRFLACAVHDARVNGFISKKATMYNEGVTSTAAAAKLACDPRPAPGARTGDASGKAWDKAQPGAKDKELAEAVRVWGTTREVKNDYDNNLKIGLTLDTVSTRHEGIVASAIAAYDREEERKIAKELEAKQNAEKGNEHFGIVGERYLLELTVTKTRSWENDFGITNLIIMENAAGTLFKTFSTGDGHTVPNIDDREDSDPRGCSYIPQNRSVVAGEKVWTTGKIKKHGEYEGRKETMLSRISVSFERIAPKWVGDDGHIFKTRKAMKAAAEEMAVAA